MQILNYFITYLNKYSSNAPDYLLVIQDMSQNIREYTPSSETCIPGVEFPEGIYYILAAKEGPKLILR